MLPFVESLGQLLGPMILTDPDFSLALVTSGSVKIIGPSNWLNLSTKGKVARPAIQPSLDWYNYCMHDYYQGLYGTYLLPH